MLGVAEVVTAVVSEVDVDALAFVLGVVAFGENDERGEGDEVGLMLGAAVAL